MVMVGDSRKGMVGLSRVLVLLLLHVWSPTRCDVVDIFRRACPYTNFCTMDSLLDAPRNGSVPCCLDCFCDEACHTYGDCCPDVLYTSAPQEHATRNNCISSVAPTVYNDFTDGSLPNSYRMFDTCPSDYTDTEGTVDKCEAEVYTADHSYNDMVIVSDRNNIIYRNIYCARCNGVTRVVRWRLKIIKCREELRSVRLEASKLKAWVMENCILVSERPDELPLNSRLIPCDRSIVNDCVNFHSNETVELCEKGPYVPFSADTMAVYKNKFCHLCNGPEYLTPELCDDNLYFLTKSSTDTISALLEMEDSFSTPTPSACGESKMMDYYINECVSLYCPPFEAVSYGTCQSIATPILGAVTVNVVYWTTNNITIANPIRYRNESVKLHARRKLRGRFNALGCRSKYIYVSLYKERDTNKLIYLQGTTRLVLNEWKCTIRAIGKIIRNRPHLTDSWLINDEMVTMKGHYSYFHLGGEKDPGLDNMILMAEYSASLQSNIVEEFVVCPYLEIDVEMYNNFLTKVKGTDKVTNLTSLSVKTETIKGVYALSEHKLAVCVDRYFYESNSANEIILYLPFASQKMFLLLYFVLLFMLKCIK